LLKAQILVHEPPPFSLLETLLWTAEEGFFLREKHIARLMDSADYFDIPIRKADLEKYLEQISSGFRTPQRIRVLLDQAGKLDSESSPFNLLEESRPLEACMAKEPINSGDVFLYHKTTRRDVYESARQDLRDFDDVLLYNEAGELTEFTIGNLVVECDDQLYTPPVQCGVLPGTFRARLIETGQVVERTIPAEQLTQCTRIYRVNSIRRWQEVKLQKQVSAVGV
jgi:para-aminobenzoate synthetase/4-amino-4-deoxychorismate lyase